MIHDFKILIRRIRTEKTLSILTLAGLTLAFCVTIPLVCNIKYHKSFDSYHPDSERIFNVYINETYHGTNDIYGELPLIFGEYFQKLFPEVENMVRTKDVSDVLITTDNTEGWKEDVLWADPSFKDVFYLKLLAGSMETFLESPNEIYISESLSTKIFGDLNSPGEIIKVDGKSFTIEGIFKDYPGNSHMKFSILIPLESRIPDEDKYEWDSYEFLTYIKVKENSDINGFENKLQSFLTQYWIPWLKSNHNLDYVSNDENSFKLKLLPVQDIHLQGRFISSFENESSSSVIRINLVLIFVLLFIAYFNLIGFSFSRGKRHHFQITIKRHFGASRNNLIGAFLLEHLTYTIIAFILSLIIIYEFRSTNSPILSDFITLSLSNYVLPVALLLLVAVIISVLSGAITGTYFNTVSLKSHSGSLPSFSQFWLNRFIVVSQMASSIVLIICIIVIFKQLKYLASYDNGIDISNILIVNNGYRIGNHYPALKSELEKSPLIADVSCSNSYPFNWMSTNSFKRVNSENQNPYPFQYFKADSGFQKVFNFKQTKGRWFSGAYHDDNSAIIFNEAAVKIMGIKNPIGEEFTKFDSPDNRYHVIGVVNDFNFRSLHHYIEPLLIMPLEENDWWRYIEIKSTTNDRDLLLAEVKKVWNRISGNEYFDYSFLEDNVSLLYEKERNLEKSISIFCIIAILISCFGLLGIIFNTTNEKTKEIGLRKINGAKVSEVVSLLIKDKVKWVIIAFLIACPIAFYTMYGWLHSFAYKTELSWWIFALAGIIAVTIALLTVSWQSWKAATRNPVEALRYE